MMSMMEHALELARRGFAVFPCVACGKVPLLSREMGGKGVLDATRNENKIGVWWSHYGTANVGIACGAISELLVLDIDATKGGVESMRKIAAEHGPAPRSCMVKTGSGWHVYYRPPSTATYNAVGFLPGLDVRTDRGYVIAPPSMHPNGSRYTWINEAEPDACPGWLARLVLPRETPALDAMPVPTRRSAPDVIERARKWLSRVEPAISGSGGSRVTMHAARGLVVGFDLDPAVAFDLLLHDYNPRCQPPWSGRELLHKVASADSAGGSRGYLLNAPKRRAA